MATPIIDEAKLAEQLYQLAYDAGEVDERDKEAVIIGALWALRFPVIDVGDEI